MVSKNKRRPEDGWKQLDFHRRFCLPNMKCGAIFFLVLFVFSLILTCVTLGFSYKIIEKESETMTFSSASTSTNIVLDSDINQTVFIYIVYLDYYQNHRIYLKSKSKYQMEGKSDSSITTNCSPLVHYGDLNLTLLVNQTKGDLILPCGTLPASYFNVTMSVTMNGKSFNISSDNIAWATDDSSKYNDQEGQYQKLSDEHFKVWMRTSATNNLRKLYGHIDEGLRSGTYNLKISYTRDHLDYIPQIKAIFSTTTRIGGKNLVHGWSFFFIMIMSLIWAIVFAVLHKYDKPIEENK